MEKELRPVWSKVFNFNWKFGVFLIFIVCIPRFILVLHANATGNYRYIGLIMVVSAVAPFIFLSKSGRKKIGLTKPAGYHWLIVALFSGAIASMLLYLAGQALYGNTFENWYVYIAKSYNIPPVMSQHDKSVLFAVMAITGMTFSPVGEELFFRGIVHSSFATSFGDAKASLADSSAFALTHISHFGLVFINHQWKFFAVPAFIWVLGMFLVSLLFFAFKKRCRSLSGAVFCHAGFNLGMIYSIFYLL